MFAVVSETVSRFSHPAMPPFHACGWPDWRVGRPLFVSPSMTRMCQVNRGEVSYGERCPAPQAGEDEGKGERRLDAQVQPVSETIAGVGIIKKRHVLPRKRRRRAYAARVVTAAPHRGSRKNRLFMMWKLSPGMNLCQGTPILVWVTGLIRRRRHDETSRLGSLIRSPRAGRGVIEW